MEIQDLITHETILSGIRGKDKKHVLQDVAAHAGRVLKLPSADIFEALWQRERLGSTGMGRGIAIPHCRINKLSELRCFFVRLETPIAFEAPDAEPVDLIFVLLAPPDAGADHLKALACISRMMRDNALAKRLRSRSLRGAQAMYAVLTDVSARPAA